MAAIFDAAGFLKTLGIRLDAVGPGWCETSLALTPALLQQHGFAHGGVITTLADHTAGGAARAAVPPGRDILTLELKINFLRPDRKNEPRRHVSLGDVRQLIESNFWTCKCKLGLERHGARDPAHLGARIGIRLLALAAGIWHNHLTHHPARAFAAYGR